MKHTQCPFVTPFVVLCTIGVESFHTTAAPETISFWLDNTGNGSTNSGVVLGGRTPGCYTSALYVNYPTSHALHWYDGGPENTIVNIADNTWNLVTVVSVPGQSTFYINGNLQATASRTFTQSLLAQIGASCSGSASFQGSMDDLRIYNHALSAAEIQALYNATK